MHPNAQLVTDCHAALARDIIADDAAAPPPGTRSTAT